MSSGPVEKILAKQQPAGYWGNEEEFYQCSKYKGTSWNLIVLSELEAVGEDPRIRKACNSILICCQERTSGGFSYKGTAENGGTHPGIIPCLTSNMVHALTYFGMLDDPRVQSGYDWLVKYQRFTDHLLKEKAAPYARDLCWRPRDCRSGAVKCLRAYSVVPEEKRGHGMKLSIGKGIDYVLTTCLGVENGGIDKNIRPEWLKLGIPHVWNTDILEIATVLKALKVEDDLLTEVKAKIISLMDPEMRLVQNGPFANRFLTRVEKVGEPSGLLTIKAYSLLS